MARGHHGRADDERRPEIQEVALKGGDRRRRAEEEGEEGPGHDLTAKFPEGGRTGRGGGPGCSASRPPSLKRLSQARL